MNLFYEEFPNTIEIDGNKIKIVTDFREYIKLLDMLDDPELSGPEKIYFLSEYVLSPVNNMEAVIKELTKFVTMDDLNPKNEENEEANVKPKKIFSFSYDYPYILSAFLSEYGIDLRSIKYLHWWKFRMLFDGLSEDTEIKKRIMYRSIDLSAIKDKDERKRIRRIQQSVRLPEDALTDFDIGEIFS